MKQELSKAREQTMQTHETGNLPEVVTTYMTREEATHALAQLRGTEERQKHLLLELHTRKAHKALGYTSWEEFADREFGMSRRRFYELLDAARVENILSQSVRNSAHFEAIAPGAADEVFIQLARLKEPPRILAAWEEATLAAPRVPQRGADSRHNGKVTTSLVKSIVDSILKLQQGKIPTRQQALPAPPPQAKQSNPTEDRPPHPADVAMVPSIPPPASARRPQQPSPSAFDLAVEQGLPAATPPALQVAPPASRSVATVKSFAPPADPDPEKDAEAIVFDEAIDALEMALTWARNRKTGSRAEVAWIDRQLSSFQRWYRASQHRPAEALYPTVNTADDDEWQEVGRV